MTCPWGSSGDAIRILRKLNLVTRALRRLGWRVVRIWEHELELRGCEKRLQARIARALRTTAKFR